MSIITWSKVPWHQSTVVTDAARDTNFDVVPRNVWRRDTEGSPHKLVVLGNTHWSLEMKTIDSLDVRMKGVLRGHP